MERVIIGVWAHPDDEMGPSGSLIKAAEEHAKIHMVFVTSGQSGENPDDSPDLGALRMSEAVQSAAQIGIPAQNITNLGFKDGELANTTRAEIKIALDRIVLNILAPITEETMLSFITLNGHSPTGHPDHRMVQELVVELFNELASQLPPHIHLSELACYCLSTDQAPLPDKDTSRFALMGCEASEIDRTFDATPYLDRKERVIDCHYSQRADGKLWRRPELITPEHFKVFAPKSAPTDQES